MAVRRIERETRVDLALRGFPTLRSRRSQMDPGFTLRQRWDRRQTNRDSADPVSAFATLTALAAGEGVEEAAQASTGSSSGGGYYSGGGGGGGGEYDAVLV